MLVINSRHTWCDSQQPTACPVVWLHGLRGRGGGGRENGGSEPMPKQDHRMLQVLRCINRNVFGWAAMSTYR